MNKIYNLVRQSRVFWAGLRKKDVKPLLLAVSLCLLPGGCLKLGPDFRTPDLVNTPNHFIQSNSIDKKTSNPKPIHNWWKDFQDPKLNLLIQELLGKNYDLQQAAARILELKAIFVQSRAGLWPQINGQGSAQRQKQNFTYDLGMGEVQASSITNNFGLSVEASYELDLFDRLRRTKEAAWEGILQGQAAQQTLKQALISQGITLYLQGASLKQKIILHQQLLQLAKNRLQLISTRYQKGLTPFSTLVQSKNDFTSLQSELETLKQQLVLKKQELAVLLGHYPDNKLLFGDFTWLRDHLPQVPVGLPSQLLKRRPDIQEACSALKAANALVGAAEAARFPQLTLTSGLGYSSDQLHTLLQPGSRWWSLAAGVVQPIFNAGQIKASQEAAEARYQESLMQYAKTVLQSFKEVEEALTTRKRILVNINQLEKIIAEQGKQLQAIKNNFAHGLTDYEQVINVQSTLISFKENLLDLETDLIVNQISLRKALGGDWTGSTEKSPKKNP